MNDNPRQAKFLTEWARHAGYATLQAFLLADPAEFMAVAAQWRLMRSFL